jgi:lysophospholipase L1-like esterase
VQEKLKADGAYHVLPVRVGATPTALRIEFEGIHSPDFYGITLDGAYGLGVDNIAMRGSSGTTFAQLPFGLFNQMIDYVNTELVIMQFGGNSAVAVKSEQGAKNYASWFKSQINVVKSVRPEAQIIVIGPSDMSMKEGEDYVTYPYMEAVIEQMKRAAHEAGAAYWDLYSAMGGKNSMPVWVEKGLAGEDYIHFTNAGSKYTSEMFVKALLLEYQKYVDSKGGGGAPAE